MSLWALILLATAFGGALVIWYGVSRTKHLSEEMLKKYAEMLAQAREEKLKKLKEEQAEESDDANDRKSPSAEQRS